MKLGAAHRCGAAAIAIAAFGVLLPTGCALRQTGRYSAPPEPAPANPIPEFAPTGLLVFVYSEIVPILELVDAAVKSTPILIIARSDSHRQEAMSELRDGGFGGYVEQSRVAIRREQLDSVWIRDYGPLFARDRSDRVIALDPVYAARTAGRDPRPRDDLAGSSLGRALKVPTLRPPLALAGGNFASDGAGRCFTSTRAIVANGGERDRLNATLRRYLGCERVVYLEPLPGPTTKHIDMFFRVARPGVALLAEYEAPPNRHTAAGHLQARARAVMERNAEILRQAAASDGMELEIVRVPTPPIAPLGQAPFQSDEARAALERPGHADPAGRPGWLERQLRDEHFVYRSFLNYVHLRTQSDDLLLVPSYPNAVDSGHAEQRAGAALQRAYPQSRIVPIDAERLIAKQGALHCATWAVPDSVDSSALFESREATAAVRPAAADAADGERAN